MLGKLFKRSNDVNPNLPKIYVGRYSDNNKSPLQMRLWDEAERLFKEGKYLQSIESFFSYLKDEVENNVMFENYDNHFKFEIIQGAIIIRGIGNPKNLHAKVSLVKMEEASVPVMRRLLENNFKLFYSRYALKEDLLTMKFDSEIETANPNKLYYALKELAVVSNRQSYTLTKDFPLLKRVDNEHRRQVNVEEKKIKVIFLRQWIEETFELINKLDPNKNVNGISILLLNLIYTIDYLLSPHGDFAIELNRIQEINQKNELPSQMQRNRLMSEAIENLQNLPDEDIFKSFSKDISTFSLRQPKTLTTVEENIRESYKSLEWYKTNGFYEVSLVISIAGFAKSQYLYSLPRPISALFEIFMEINHSKFFFAFYNGYNFYEPQRQHFYIHRIEREIIQVEKIWKTKYPNFRFAVEKLEYNNLLEFNLSFTKIVSSINLDN